MKINACFIVKDDSEAEKLEAAIHSVEKHVDGVYVTSTGKKVDDIKWLCDTKKYKYSHFPWNDNFSDARNFNFSQVPKDTDYIFWMDADDILVNGQQLQDVAKIAKQTEKDVVFFTYWYGCSFSGEPSIDTLQDVEISQMRERLIRPGSITWKKRLHETPVPVEGSRHKYTSVPYKQNPQHEYEFSIAVMHTAEVEDLPEKMERNRRILELELEDERKENNVDPRTLIYLMKIYAEQDVKENWLKVIPMGKEYLEKSGWDEERGAAYEQMGIVSGKLEDHKAAAEYFRNAIDEWPHSVILYLRKASAHYNLKQYDKTEHWMNLASQMDIDKQKSAGAVNIKAIKEMFASLLLNLNYHVHLDTSKALEAAKLLYAENPTEHNKSQLEFIEDANDLNEACRHMDKLAEYLDSIGMGENIPQILNSLPQAMNNQPFAQKLRRAFTPPRKWERDEICYFANFGGKFFEQWGPSALEKGIGGSETAVIELSKEWAKLGYRVTIYGDPGAEQGTYERVTYLPWYYFNKNDYFNIFIQWRGWQLADNIKSRKFLVDMHDIFSPVDLKEDELQAIDKIMVKSQYHRSLAPKISDEKFMIVSNGIRV